MRVAVFGAGAVGGYFGGRLAAAGADVAFLARGRHLEALRDGGLSVESPLGDLRLAEVDATDDPGAIGPVDVVLVTVKTWQLEEAMKYREFHGPKAERAQPSVAIVPALECAFGGFPSLAADTGSGPYGGSLYHVCSGRRDGIVLRRSGDRGETWDDPVFLRPPGRSSSATAAASEEAQEPSNGEGSSAVEPSDTQEIPNLPFVWGAPGVAVTRQGLVGVVWADKRSAPRDCFDLWFSASRDGAATFLEPLKITPQPSCPSTPEVSTV